MLGLYYIFGRRGLSYVFSMTTTVFSVSLYGQMTTSQRYINVLYLSSVSKKYLEIILDFKDFKKTLQLTSPSRECLFIRSSVSYFSFWFGTTRGILKRNLGLWCSRPKCKVSILGVVVLLLFCAWLFQRCKKRTYLM